MESMFDILNSMQTVSGWPLQRLLVTILNEHFVAVFFAKKKAKEMGDSVHEKHNAAVDRYIWWQADGNTLIDPHDSRSEGVFIEEEQIRVVNNALDVDVRVVEIDEHCCSIFVPEVFCFVEIFLLNLPIYK